LHLIDRILISHMRYLLSTIFLSFGFISHAQQVDNTAIYRNIGSSRYVRLHYENDYFSKTDIYYTQGINLELVHPTFKSLPTSHILLKQPQKEIKTGIAIEHLGFTPTSISHREILDGDRPFASCFFAKTFSITNDSLKNYRLASGLTIGIIGPGAGGKKFQQAIHRWINDEPPLGWDNQIRNDLILNYAVDFEKRIFAHDRNFLATWKTGGQLGTLRDKIFGSVTFMTGVFDNPYQFFSRKTSWFQMYVFFEPLISVVGYDATLQGGLLNHKINPYVISSADVTRTVFQYNTGLVVRFKKVSVEYFQHYLTKEFRTGQDHRWGGVRIAVSFGN
jgi:lipid A 3-O-deacylase